MQFDPTINSDIVIEVIDIPFAFVRANQLHMYTYPADTQRSNNVIITSKRRRDVVLT